MRMDPDSELPWVTVIGVESDLDVISEEEVCNAAPIFVMFWFRGIEKKKKIADEGLKDRRPVGY